MLLNTRIRRRLPESKIIIAVVVVSQLLRSSVHQQAFAYFSCFRAARIFEFFVKLSKTARLATGNNQSLNHDPGSNSVSHTALYGYSLVSRAARRNRPPSKKYAAVAG